MGLSAFNFSRAPKRDTSTVKSCVTVVQCHSRSLKLVLIKIHTLYDFLLVFHCKYVGIFYCFRDFYNDLLHGRKFVGILSRSKLLKKLWGYHAGSKKFIRYIKPFPLNSSLWRTDVPTFRQTWYSKVRSIAVLCGARQKMQNENTCLQACAPLTQKHQYRSALCHSINPALL